MVYVSVAHQRQCLTAPIPSSIVMGGIFTGINLAQGYPAHALPRSFALNTGLIYTYHALQVISPAPSFDTRPDACS